MTELCVQVVLGEISGLSGPPIAVSEGTQALQPLGYNAGKPLLPR